MIPASFYFGLSINVSKKGIFFKEYLEKYLLLLTTVVGPVEDDVEHFAHINTSLPPSTAIFGFVEWNKQLQTGPLQIAQVDLEDLRSMIGQSINASSIDSNNKPLPHYCLKFSL
jgi:hypothetical protein